MTKQEFHQNLYDSIIDRFTSLDENWSTFLDSPIKEIKEGRILNHPAVRPLLMPWYSPINCPDEGAHMKIVRGSETD